MGFGHRVYKAKDPRATDLMKLRRATRQRHRQRRPLRQEQQDREDHGARELAAKGIYPNVDFYSATTYHCIGLKLDLFTPMFALSRIGGWSGHIIEQLSDNRLFRPTADYVGPHDRALHPNRSALTESRASKRGGAPTVRKRTRPALPASAREQRLQADEIRDAQRPHRRRSPPTHPPPRTPAERPRSPARSARRPGSHPRGSPGSSRRR